MHKLREQRTKPLSMLSARNAALALALLAGPQLASAAPSPYEPLSVAEEASALHLAHADPRVQALLGQGTRMELIYVERHEEAKGAPAARRADVVAYLYGREQALQVRVDLGAGRVDAVTAQPGVQPPLNDAESRRALDLALADREAGRAIRTEYQAVTGRPLGSVNDLQWRALIFLADAHPSAASGPAADCGKNRCAQLMLTNQDDTVVNVLPLIDLSRGAAVGATAFGGN